MTDFSYLLDPSLAILLVPFIFVILFSIFFQTIESSYFFVNASRSLYSLVLALMAYLVVGDLVWPPEDFFHSVIISLAAISVLLFFGRFLRLVLQFVVFNFILFFMFKDQIQQGWLLPGGIVCCLNLLFAALYPLAIGRKNILIKIFHSLLLLALVHWAFYQHQGLVGQIAILCSLSLLAVTIQKVIFFKRVIPNFSRPFIDVGLPIILLWVLLNASGVLNDFFSNYFESVPSFTLSRQI